MVLSRKRASEGLYPAIDPLQSSSEMLVPHVVGQRHYDLAREVRRTLAHYDELKDVIAMSGLEELSREDRRTVNRARRLERFLTQPFFTTEQFTGNGGRMVEIEKTLDGCDRVLSDDLHSRLLERSTHLCDEAGGGSLTALPIVQTEAQNVSAYIPTNLISITDGQIYLAPHLFRKGLLPAVDVGRSVSRVGGKTQLSAYRAVAADLRLAYSQFEELEKFARFSSQLDEATRSALERGRRIREVFKQSQHAPLTVPEQVAVLVAVTQGVFDTLAIEQIANAETTVCRAVTGSLPELCQRIAQGEKLSNEELGSIRQTAAHAVKELI